MINFGAVKPGTTLFIPFHTFDSNDPSASVTITGLATTDIEIYKDGGATTRASDSGYTLLDTDGIDFASTTGVHGFSVDLSDNSAANFYEAGSQYWVVVASVTVDAAVVNFVAATFRIGYPGAILDTTIATLASQVSFTLEEGPADDDALNGCLCIVHDLASSVQTAQALVSDYDETAGTLTVTLAADPGIFTMAAGDNVSFFPAHALAVWDRIMDSTNHNINKSAGKRMRLLAEAGNYTGGFIFIDTVNGSAGTENFENGTEVNAVDSIADANTIAGSVGLEKFSVSPGSSITFPGAQTDEIWEGRDWTLALNGQDITSSFIFGAIVTGIGVATGPYEFEECDIGVVTLDNDGHIERCALTGTFTVGQAGTFTFHQCFTESAAAITIDFAAGSPIGGTAIHMLAFDGEINFKNMAAGDTVHITGGGTITTETCTAGTIKHGPLFEYTDAGGNVTEQKADIEDVVDAVKLKTDDLTFTKALELDANIQSINDAEVVGDGSGTPWNGA